MWTLHTAALGPSKSIPVQTRCRGTSVPPAHPNSTNLNTNDWAHVRVQVRVRVRVRVICSVLLETTRTSLIIPTTRTRGRGRGRRCRRWGCRKRRDLRTNWGGGVHVAPVSARVLFAATPTTVAELPVLDVASISTNVSKLPVLDVATFRADVSNLSFVPIISAFCADFTDAGFRRGT